ncbi:hypothetical protein [Akkermansia muciniphila]|uniref:hypothetical protein n=2 Tax=Akkermansia muciniphila TaxID=239935 RepID=UPI001561CCAE|nr:hypothetical protein [Akkermansia muciniphila]
MKTRMHKNYLIIIAYACLLGLVGLVILEIHDVQTRLACLQSKIEKQIKKKPALFQYEWVKIRKFQWSEKNFDYSTLPHLTDKQIEEAMARQKEHNDQWHGHEGILDGCEYVGTLAETENYVIVLVKTKVEENGNPFANDANESWRGN